VAKNDIVVCDRTILDNLAYARRARFDFVESFLPVALRWIKTCSEIYFCGPNGHLAEDGFRSADPGFQGEIDRILAEYITACGIKVLERNDF